MSITIHNPYVPRLIRAAFDLQQLINSNAIFEAYDGDEGKALPVSTAIDEFNAACGQVSVGQKLDQANPYLVHRAEILGGYSTAQRLASLVLHLYNGNRWMPDLPSLLGNADENHTAIALRCIAWYAEKGENCPVFMALAREILRRDHPELCDD